MKSIYLFITTIALFGLVSCNNGNKQNVHTHEDGSQHENHSTEQTLPKQESFTEKADSVPASSPIDEHDHDHNHGEHGHNH